MLKKLPVCLSPRTEMGFPFPGYYAIVRQTEDSLILGRVEQDAVGRLVVQCFGLEVPRLPIKKLYYLVETGLFVIWDGTFVEPDESTQWEKFKHLPDRLTAPFNGFHLREEPDDEAL